MRGLTIIGVSIWIALLFGSMGQSAETVLLTGYQQDTPPRYFMQNGQEKGFCIDIFHALNQKLQGTSLRIVSKGWYPLPRITHMMEEDELQIFIGLIRNPEREQKFLFGKTSLFEFRPVFVKLAEDSFEYTDAASLHGKSVGTERGSAFSREMHDIPGVDVQDVPTMRQNLLKLLAHHVDLVYYYQLGLEWEIKEGGLTNQIVFMKNAFGETQMHYVMFSKSVPQHVVDEIDRALADLKADGTIDRILAAYRLNDN